jgi:hypothetical protein
LALLEDALKGGNLVTGLAIGIGAAVLAPMVMPLVRPAAKSLLKAGLYAYDQGRVALAELNERGGDLMTEVRAELEGEAGKASSEGASEKRREAEGKK